MRGFLTVSKNASEPKRYTLRYLPLFEEDLAQIVDYIVTVLENPDAAEHLLNAIEDAILQRSVCAEAFEQYPSRRERRYPYYRIYVENYIVFYVVTGDVMEVRRILYGGRNIKEYI